MSSEVRLTELSVELHIYIYSAGSILQRTSYDGTVLGNRQFSSKYPNRVPLYKRHLAKCQEVSNGRNKPERSLVIYSSCCSVLCCFAESICQHCFTPNIYFLPAQHCVHFTSFTKVYEANIWSEIKLTSRFNRMLECVCDMGRQY